MNIKNMVQCLASKVSAKIGTISTSLEKPVFPIQYTFSFFLKQFHILKGMIMMTVMLKRRLVKSQ